MAAMVRIVASAAIGAVVAASTVAAAASAAPSASASGVPQRNLVVELRWVEADRGLAAGAVVAQGGLVVGTAGSADARGGVVLRSGRPTADGGSLERVTVLNGHRASIRRMQAVPLQWVDVAVTPNGPVAVVREEVTESGTEIAVQPVWRGGQAPVELSVLARRRPAPSGRFGQGVPQPMAPVPSGLDQAERADTAGSDDVVVTTVRLRPNEWTTLARDARGPVGSADGVLSSTDAARRASRELQARVLVP